MVVAGALALCRAASRTVKGPALVTTRLSLSWVSWAAQSSLQRLGSPDDQLQSKKSGASSGKSQAGAAPTLTGTLWSICSVVGRIALSLLAACILYALPLWGTPLRTPIFLLPVERSAAIFGTGGDHCPANDTSIEAVAEVEVARWAAALAGRVVVDVDLELTLPNSPRNTEFSGAARVSLEFGGRVVSRPLVLHHLPEPARRVRELLFAIPMAVGLWYDEQTTSLSLADGLRPEELAVADANSSSARLRLTPALVARHAQITFRPRPAGCLSGFLTSFFGFVPLCAVSIFLIFFSKRKGASASSALVSVPKSNLDFVEVQMLAKALGNRGASGASHGIVRAHFSATLAAFEAEDLRRNRATLRGLVPLTHLPLIVEGAAHEWSQVGFDQAQMRRTVAATFMLPASPCGIVTEEGEVRYQLWLAIASVALLCGRSEFAEYAAWVAQHSSRLELEGFRI
mmetsp:Transcript_13528/g.29701  ORF Transcript_13528/g.29701 Transcript_13528/m.29701 type:complete len:458 (-) Transcript_13528:150-1523(-)